MSDSTFIVFRSTKLLGHSKGIKMQDDAAMKAMLHRIVAMLTRMAMKFDGVAESSADYDAAIDYDYEHRFVPFRPRHPAM